MTQCAVCSQCTRWVSVLVRAVWCGVVALAATAAQAQCLNPSVLQVVLIPHNSFNEQEAAQQPLLQAIQQETGKQVEAVAAVSYAAVLERLLAGEAQVAELGPASYALLRQRSPHFEPFASLSNRAQGIDSYQSLLVVRKDAPLQRLEQLRGKSVAFTDPYSTSGAIVPSLMVQRVTGYAAEHFFARVLYTGAHDKSVAAVQQGRAHAAFVASSLVDVQAQGLRVLWRSPPLAGNPFLLDSRLCPKLQAQLQRAFLTQPARLAPWLALRNFAHVVPVTQQDYAEMEALLQQP